jgi:dihydroorotate dehydrogenase
MYWLLRPFLFLLDAEVAHQLTMGLLKIVLKIPGVGAIFRSSYAVQSPELQRTHFELLFQNPVGLAAGMDKNASIAEDWRHLGFGFIEIGTVTPKPQGGNPKPRLYRLLKDKALLNRMGFNNYGMDVVAKRLGKRRNKLLVGGNIGKNKDTPNERAGLDYELCYRKLAPYVDFITVNVSSPNTPGLRALQGKEELTKILNRLNDLNFRLLKYNKPILLKIAPDLSNEQLDEIIEIVKGCYLSGIIATNTTLSRENLKTKSVEAKGAGGISGAPLTKRSLEVVSYLRQGLGPTTTIIGVGGIMSPEDAVAMIEAGANLIQIYTGLVYRGPALIAKINKAILKAKVLPPDIY